MSISKKGEDPTSYEKPSWIIYVLVEYMASTNTICVCLKQEYNWNWGENNNYIKRQILKRRGEKKESNMWLWKKNVQLMLHCSRLKCFYYYVALKASTISYRSIYVPDNVT